MLQVEMTPQLLGIRIRGDYDALNDLYDAIHRLTVTSESPDPDQHGTPNEEAMSTRLLALCYDLRHAYMGTRGLERVPSGVDPDACDWYDLPADQISRYNMAFSVEVLYPEAMYELLALSYLVNRRGMQLERKGSNRLAGQTRREFDQDSAIVRLYQSRVIDAVARMASKGRFTRILESLQRGWPDAPAMYLQWLDVINADYLGMSRKRREESVATVVRDLAEFLYNDQYLQIQREVAQAAKKYNCPRTEIKLNIDWPDTDPDW